MLGKSWRSGISFGTYTGDSMEEEDVKEEKDSDVIGDDKVYCRPLVQNYRYSGSQ